MPGRARALEISADFPVLALAVAPEGGKGTMKLDFVTSYTRSGTATWVIMLLKSETNWPMKSNR